MPSPNRAPGKRCGVARERGRAGAARYRLGPMSDDARGPSTRAVHAGLPAASQGDPFLPGPVLAAPTHWAGEFAPVGYGRYENATWSHLEAAIGALDGGDCVVFSSGMAATAAVLDTCLKAGDVLALPADGYYAIRKLVDERLPARGVEVRLVASDTVAMCEAAAGAALVWVETPSNPALDVVDIAAVAQAAHAAGALLAVDNTVATPLGTQPLALGADLAVISGTKALAGHSDVLLGAVSVRDAQIAADLHRARMLGGAILGPFEAWLAHRSLATLALRLERASANAVAVAAHLREAGVEGVVHPADDPLAARQMRWFGPLVSFALPSAAAAERFLAGCAMVADATSFGGVHSSAERRGRHGTDAVPEGFIRFSCGIEDTADLLADVDRGLAAARA